MARSIKIFKSFEEQEMYFLQYFASLTPSERLRSLSKLQKAWSKNEPKKITKKITLRKHFVYGY